LGDADADIGFEIAASGMPENQFNAYDFNKDGGINLQEYLEGELKREIFSTTLRHDYFQSVETTRALEYYGDIMSIADADYSGFITEDEYWTALNV